MDGNKAITSSGISKRATEQPFLSYADSAFEKNTDADALGELMQLLQQADLNSPLARLNETTISDNNGGRIEL